MITSQYFEYYCLSFLHVLIGNTYFQNVIGEVYEVDESMLKHLDILEEHPTFYTRELEQIVLFTDDVGLESWIYLLKKFKPEMLEREHFADYSSSGAHGLVYSERYQRDPSYNCKQDVIP